ncbi:superinfection exclusion B family protein [Pseudomonas synxantha]|uniref:superinfection exclusion B family protein n=1 Tax=Pseudomonas synxantha TaxID=47883 RepID=UPI002368B404|nr:superinfection exclusion B family protein [Pseudomonas synxantha]WDG39759.1 superinfection exclusion B family protein [Pseudomonas synxantha]
MLAELLKFALELLKLAPRYFVALGVVAAGLLFMPADWLSRLGVEKFADDNKQWLGLVLLVSTVLWGVFVIVSCWGAVQRVFYRRKNKARTIRKLRSLTEGEKEILRYYLAEGTRTNVLKVDDGVVQGLVAYRIIYRAASMGNLMEGFAHNITELAWDYLHLYPEVLEGTGNFYRTDKRQRGW